EPAEDAVHDDRRRDDWNRASDGRRDPADRVAGAQLLRAEDGDRLAREPAVDDGRSGDPNDVADEDRPESRRPQADEREERERVQGAAHMIEKMVASPVDHAGLEDR